MSYCVSFRISEATVGGKTYAERRQSLINNAYEGSDGYWEETTSFLMVGSSLKTGDFTEKICKGLSAKHDLVLVFDPTDMSASYFGPFKHADVLRSFLPRAKKLP